MPVKKRKRRARPLPALFRRLKEHFGRDPGMLPVVEQSFAPYERPNLHLALEELLAAPRVRSELIGVVIAEDYHSVALPKLARPASAGQMDAGPVLYIDVDMAGDRRLACVRRGLYLIAEGKGRLAVLVTPSAHEYPPRVNLAVMAGEQEHAETFLRRLARLTRHGKAYRGQVFSLEVDCNRELSLKFHRLPDVARDQVILPERLLNRIERHTVSFSRHADRLRAAGRHLKRGVLLYGPPGTGKTLSAMYLASRMPGRTVVLLTGGSMGSIETACGLARLLEPATVILEDVDLIGTQREDQTVGANALLFELLNQMDGLAEDADVLFVLTTNRPEMLEPALAARPGRIDQAIEVPLPDADCRRRMIALYGKGLSLELVDPESVVRRTAGVSGAFLRELLRRAAVYAAEDGADAGSAAGERDATLVVRDRHVDEAIGELLMAGGPLTRSLLGAAAAGDKGTADGDGA